MDSSFDPYQPLQRHQQETVKHFFAVESESVDPDIFKKKHLQILRDHVVRLICRHSRSENEKFDAYIPYLALNYFDRFISRNPLPIIRGKDLNYRALILSLCCLSLACKIRSHSSSNIFLRQRGRLEFDTKHVLELELKILSGLEWKMYSVNAMCFVRYFMTIASIPGLSFRRISEIIIQAQGDIYFTEFKPSVLAASAILTAIHFQNRGIVDFCRGILTKGGLVQLNESEVNRCMFSMIGMWVCMGNMGNAPRMRTDGASMSGSAAGVSTVGGVASATPRMRTDGASTSGSATAGESTVGGDDSAKLPYTRRPGKEIVSEIEKVPKPKQTQVPVSTLLSAESKEKNNLNLDFELKWITNDNQYEGLLMTLDPSLFLPEAKRSRIRTWIKAKFPIRTWLKAKFCMSIAVQEHEEDEA